jgi:hypothetical protein
MLLIEINNRRWKPEKLTAVLLIKGGKGGSHGKSNG